MTDVQMLAGSLSNDLMRVASLAQRGSDKAASRYLQEAQRWSKDLQNQDVPKYISRLAEDVSNRSTDDISIDSAYIRNGSATLALDLLSKKLT